MTRRRGRMRPGVNVTLADVAAAANVSRASVSRVINSLETVTPEIEQRVRTAIDQLGYQPSSVARSLSLGVTQVVGIVVPDLSNPTFQQILHAVNRSAAVDGYRLLIADSEGAAQDEVPLVEEIRRRADAVIIVSPRMPEIELAKVARRVSPVVLINRDDDIDVGRVQIDYATGVAELARHLISLGHQRLVHLDGPPASQAQTARARGLAVVVRAFPGIEVIHLPCGDTIDDGYAALSRVLDTEATAVMAFNDLVALGLLARAAEESVPVPQRLSVAGFDDIRFASLAPTSLTTMRVSLDAIGREGWRILHDRLLGYETVGQETFAPRLIVRASTGQPSRR